jgi:hypothetical protein
MKQALKHVTRQSYQIQSDGIVIGREGGEVTVDTEYGELCARRAVSCLVEPAVGDRVLVAGDLNEDLFVIALLEQGDVSATRITVDGDLHLGVPNGRFSIVSAQGVDMVSAGDISLTSSEFSVRSDKGHIFFEELSYIGRKVLAQTGALKFVGGIFDTIAERVSQKVKRSYRVVEEIDQVRSNQIDYRAEKNMSLKGQNALVTANELVKIEGDQIHLG